MTLSVVASIKSYKLKWSKPFRLFAAFLFATFIIEVFAISWQWFLYDAFRQDYSQSNLWIYNGYVGIRHIFLISFFYHLVTSRSVKQIILWTTLSFTLFFLINYGFIQTPFLINSYSIILSNILISLAAVVFFKQVIEYKEVISLTKSTEIWLALGCFIYYSGSLPFFMLFNRLIESDSPLLASLLFINDGLNIIMYSLFLTAYICSPKIQK